MRLTCKVKFDLGSVSHWSGTKESCAHPCVIHPPMLGCKCSHLLKTDPPGLVRFLTWLLRSRPMTHRTQIKLHLTGKPRLILVFFGQILVKEAVSRQSSSFCSILPINCPQSLWNLKKANNITCKWQSQRFETNKYVSWALFLKLQTAEINFEKWC